MGGVQPELASRGSAHPADPPNPVAASSGMLSDIGGKQLLPALTARTPAPRRPPSGLSVGIFLYLLSVGIVATATVGVFYGIAFFFLAHTTEAMNANATTREHGSDTEPRLSHALSNVSPTYGERASVPIEPQIPRSAATAALPVASVAPPIADRLSAICPQVTRRTNPSANGRRTRVPAKLRQTLPRQPHRRLNQHRLHQSPRRVHQSHRRVYQSQCRPLREPRASPPSKLRSSWPAATPSFTPVTSRRHGCFTSAQPLPGTGSRRCGWGRRSIRPFSTELACARSATRSERNPGTAMRLTSAGLRPIIKSRAHRRNSHRKD